MKHNEPETMCSLEWLKHERRKAWQEGYAAGWKDQECDFPPHTSENPYKEYQKMSDNVNHPKHYENGPFECIELSRLLSSDWGQVVQYCFRWQHKNGVEDLKKALWFINDALNHNVPPIAAWNREDACASEAKADTLLKILATENWADLGRFWLELEHGTAWTVRRALTEKINEIEKEGK